MAKPVNEAYDQAFVKTGGRIDNSFGAMNRRNTYSDPLEEGDTFTIPTDLTGQVHHQDMNGNDYAFLRLEVTNKNTGATTVKNIGASVFNRIFTEYDEKGVSTGNQVYADGAVSNKFNENPDLDKAFAAISGKAIVISKVRRALGKSFRVGQLTQSQLLYTTEWA